MLYDIDLTISYDYENAAGTGRHLLRLAPLNAAGEQRVISSLLEISPRPDERADRRDFFGNAVAEVAFQTSVPKLRFSLRARVERLQPFNGLDISPRYTDIAGDLLGVTDMGPESPHHFSQDSPRIQFDEAMTAYARAALHDGMSAYGAVCAIGLALHRDMSFDPDATSVETSAAEAFERRHGVCQDYTHIMITCLRGIGIPAGYVSGYLRTIPPEGQEPLEGADAMHAWVRAWCGKEFGWLEYDPTNALLVGPDHIVAARGRDYSDIAPVCGALRTYGTQESKQAVTVRPLASES